MIEILRNVLTRASEQLSYTTTTYLPPLLAGLIIILIAYVLAVACRWILLRIFKGNTADRFLRQTGLSYMPAARLAAEVAFWMILGIGFLTALSAFNTALSTRIIEDAVFLFPKLIAAAAILLVGVWLAQYLGRSMLIWACNEGIPYARRLAAAVRILIIFVAVVAAADHINFARNVFLAAFLMICGGAVIAGSIAVGLVTRDALQRHLSQERSGERRERSLWNHL